MKMARPVMFLSSLILLFASSSCTEMDDPPGTGGSAGVAGSTAAMGGAATSGASGNGGLGDAGSAGSGVAGSAGAVGGLGGGAASGGSSGGGANGGAGGSVAAGGTAGASGAAGLGGAPSSSFALTSSELMPGGNFADKNTCAAAGFNGSLSPELSWTMGPSGTKSYAITLIDVTLTKANPPSKLGYHWVLYNIPATTLKLPKEFKDAASLGASQNSAYLGPCPNFSGGSEVHDYEFTIYALASETLSISPTSGTDAVQNAETKLEANHLAVAKLAGKSDASPP
jgi:Raf kinase inhibitor-like YbhB/YbcL family protein